MSKKEEDFKYISENDYKTLLTVYQQKTFDLFNQNIALEAKVSTLNSLIQSLTDKINEMTKEKEKSAKISSRKSSKSTATDSNMKDENKDEILEGETFN